MKRIQKERDRLLRRLARASGLTGVACALLVVVAVARGDDPLRTLLQSVLVLAAGASVILATRSGGIWVSVLVVASSTAAAAAVAAGAPDQLGTTAATLLAGLVASSAGIILVARPDGIPLVAGLAAAVLVATWLLVVGDRLTPTTLVPVAACWFASAAMGRGLTLAIARTAERIDEVGRQHRAERMASETEAQQRRDARVLHDTVLATLSLLAHSGVGVGAGALRQQAGDDARLLRLLRLGAPLEAGPNAIFSPGSELDGGLSATFESVRKRFARMGLDVNWHGTGHLALPRETIDALIGALGECLENVRRHSGVNEADVTITDDDRTVRAMVSDSGLGFEPDTVDPARLGFAESVVGRLRAVGGRARVFSSPGAGTTVMLEVPKP